jgi:hypothetical protein
MYWYSMVATCLQINGLYINQYTVYTVHSTRTKSFNLERMINCLVVARYIIYIRVLSKIVLE